MNSTPATLTALVSRLRTHAAAFLFVFFLVFVFSLIVLSAVGAVPELVLSESPIASDEAEETVTPNDAIMVGTSTEPTAPAAPVTVPAAEALPLTITIDALDRTVKVLNPNSRTIADLDAALLQGVVRHPDSATFAEEGTMFILGHSSYLPTVNNKNFQAFNGVQKLTWGDTIRVRSATTEYVYQVERVYQARAEEVSVPVRGTGARLTLATCNSFGSKDDRHIVEATLISSTTL